MSARTRRSIVAIARGLRRELRAQKDIAIDERGRARKDGRFITAEHVARAARAIRKAIAPKKTRKPKTPPQRVAKPPPRTRPRTLPPHEPIIRDAVRDRELRELRDRVERAESALARERAAKTKPPKKPKVKRPTPIQREVAELRARVEQSERARAEAEAARKHAETTLARERAARPPPPTKPPKKPPPPPEKPERPKKGKGKKPKKPKKVEPLADGDLAILASWDNVDFTTQQSWRVELSPAGLRELERREAEAAGVGKPPVAAKTPANLRDDLEKALARKGVKAAIAKEVDNDIVRRDPKTPQGGETAWIDQHRASLRHPRMLVETDEDAIRAAKKAHIPKREKKGTRFHATVVAITQHPPVERYAPHTVTGSEDLFVIYISARSATSRAGLRRNIAAAIRDVLSKLPGGAPLYIAAIEVRSSPPRKK